MVLIAVMATGVALAQTVAGLDAGLLHLAPALVVLLPLLAGRYVGEERLADLALARRAPRPRAAALLCARLPRAPRVTIARGSALLAAALAERGPPAVLTASR